MAHSNDMASKEYVVITDRTQQEPPSTHDTLAIFDTKEPPKTLQFMEPLVTDVSPIKRKEDQTPAISIKMAVAERDKLMKKIQQSAQLRKQTGNTNTHYAVCPVYIGNEKMLNLDVTMTANCPVWSH